MNTSLIIEKSCSFFGHRVISVTEELKQDLRNVIEDLIVNHNVRIFLFGSKSDFNSLCYLIVTELKVKYTFIKRVVYTCRGESCVLESEKKEWEEIYRKLNRKEFLFVYDEEQEHKSKYTAGRASYIERNQAMIDDSEYCIFYYDEDYQPERRKYSRKCVGYYQPKSGTSLAYAYANQKKKVLINTFKDKLFYNN